jgi:hypothetical protein
MLKMKRRKYIPILSLILLIVVVSAVSCKKDEPANPYADLVHTVDNDNPTADNLPEGSFAWLHAKIFKPNCANSGCHDGTFEPEFRTLASSYNSLVHHPVIANNPQNSFSYRVVPGNAGASWLHERLTVDVENTTGIMPAVVDVTSDWDQYSALYIEKVTAWINDGAKDMFGNNAPPLGTNAPPLVYGLVVFPTGNTTDPYPREENSIYGIGSILVPATTVDIYVLPYDDIALQTGFATVDGKLSESVSDFNGATNFSFGLTTPLTAMDFNDGSQTFYYKATVDLSALESGSSQYLRVYMNDGVQSGLTEVPNNSSNYFWFLLMSLKIV